jgi:diphthine synthase
MVLYIVGLGLGDEKDITVRGLEAIQRSDKVFLEAYTSILGISHERLEAFYNKPIVVANRNFVECQAEQIYEPAKDNHVALLVVGDPVCATTHTDIILRARGHGVVVEIIHNASVMGAVGSCGLQLYNFGATVSIPFFEDNWRPTSFYSKIQYNRNGGMHTLCLLDIKVKEPDYQGMIKNRGKIDYLPPRFMTVNVALEQLIEVESMEKKNAYDPQTTLCVGMARLGQMDQCIKVGTMEELLSEHFGDPLHCLVICGDTHELETEYMKQFMVPKHQGLSDIQ